MTIIQCESGGITKYISVPGPSEAKVENPDRIPHHPRRNLQKNQTQSGELEPIERSNIACLGDRIVDECPLAALAFVGPIRLVVGIAVMVFASLVALGAYVSCKKELSKEWSYILQRAFDEATRGVLECFLFPMIWRDRDRNTLESRGSIRGGEAYGNFMYKGPDDTIFYSKTRYEGEVTWELRPIEDEWVGRPQAGAFQARFRNRMACDRIQRNSLCLSSNTTIVSD